jgi:NAD(P)-dependent dehydrogenase (short-subunit alcohol dehydrogenase family)
MDYKIAGRRALVTGSTTGIGFATIVGLAREGASVIVNGRHEGGVNAAIARLKSIVPNVKAEGIAADAASAEGAKSMVGRFPDIDILVNNLGKYERKGFFETSDEDWVHFFEFNVLSGIRLARAYGEGMRRRGWGRIVFISSESGLLVPVEMINYGVSKTAQIAVARGLARELSGGGVTVNSVLPGPTATEGINQMLVDDSQRTGKSAKQLEQEFFVGARPTSLIQRFASTEEIANMIVYVCSEAASATTGAALRVEGGIVTGLG